MLKKRLFSQILFKLLATITGLYNIRWLNTNIPKETLAEFNILIAYIAIFIVALNLGIPILIQKYFTNNPSQKNIKSFWTTVFVLRIITYFIGILGIIITLPISGTENLVLALSIYSMSFILLLDQSYKGLTDAIGNTWQYTLTDFLGKVIIVSLLFFYNFNHSIPPEYYFLLVSSAAYIISFVSDFWLQSKYIGWGKVDLKILQTYWKTMFFLTITNILISLYSTTDKLFLKNLNYSASEIIGYTNAYKLFETALILPSITIPTISSAFKKSLDLINSNKNNNIIKFFSMNMKESQILFIKYSGISLFIGLFSAISLFIGGFLVIKFIDPNTDYPLTLKVFPILSLSLITQSLNIFFAYIIILSEKEKYDTYANVLNVILSLVLFSNLIRLYGGIGAAWGVVLLYLFHFLINSSIILFLRKQIFRK
jgi:O-antigen/teichoic acid export membrane protein